MSLLLEALKQAALEKKNKGKEASSDTKPVSTQADHKPSEIEHSIEEFLLHKADAVGPDAKTSIEAARTEQTSTDNTAELEWDDFETLDEGWDTAEEIDLDIPEQKFETPPATSTLDEEIEQFRTESQKVSEDPPEEVEQEPADTPTTHFDNNPEKAALSLQPHLVPEVAQQEIIEELSNEAEEKQERAEGQAKDEQAFSHGRLEHLLVGGREVARRARRRQNFLYFTLLLTAVGGVTAYYFYLLGRAGPSLGNETVVTDTANLQIPERLITPPPSNSPVTMPPESSTNPIVDPKVEDTPPGEPVTASTSGLPDEPVNEDTTPDQDSQARNQQNRNDRLAVAIREDAPPSKNALLSALASGSSATLNSQVFTRKGSRTVSEAVTIRQGFDAFQRGDLDAAEAFYSEALSIVPDNRDAILGAAAVATARERWSEAYAYYQSLLGQNSQDREARIGALTIRQRQGGSSATRSELNSLLQAFPNSAQLHFLKGANHAMSNQWAQAQDAFFEAHRLDRANPDYAFNLAVALDHLRQRDKARSFYAEALRLAGFSSASFDMIQTRNRIAQLEQP